MHSRDFCLQIADAVFQEPKPNPEFNGIRDQMHSAGVEHPDEVVLPYARDLRGARYHRAVVGGDAKSCLAAYTEVMGRDVPQDKQPTDIPAVGSARPWADRSLDWKRRT